MFVNTTRFGKVNVDKESVLHMEDGMLGFQECKSYALLEDQSDTPFKWLQSLDDPALAFIVVNPMDFFQDYDIELTDEDAKQLGIEDPTDAVVVTTVTIDKNDGWTTTNLLGPVVINAKNLNAKQIVLQDERYGTKHMIGRKIYEDNALNQAAAA